MNEELTVTENTLVSFQDNLVKNAETERLTNVQLLTLFVFGLSEEAGEVSGKFKRLIRGDYKISLDTFMSDEIPLINLQDRIDHQTRIAYELGDVIWYAAAIGWLLGYSLEDILRMNIEKTHSRNERGLIKGTGDNR